MEDEGSEEPPAPGTEEDTPLKPSAQTTVVTSQVRNALCHSEEFWGLGQG